MELKGADEIVPRTSFPPRNIFTRPLRGKTNAELVYRIRVPRQTHLVLHHPIGDYKRKGAFSVGARMSRDLGLPKYRLDLRVGIGDVNIRKNCGKSQKDVSNYGVQQRLTEESPEK